MDGVVFHEENNTALCCIESFSDELRKSLRENLSCICHGKEKSNSERLMYSYNATIKAFWARYCNKKRETQIGMLGELLSHVIILNLFHQYEVISPFFNLEEKSIKKGFDILLFEKNSKLVWITEVKSGELHKNKNSNSTTIDLLRDAKNDLKIRLSENEQNHWLNAVNAARIAIDNSNNDRGAIIDILESEGDMVIQGTSTAKNNNVFLISTLFNDLSDRVLNITLTNFSSKLSNEKIFNSFFVFSLQKETLNKVELFLKDEASK